MSSNTYTRRHLDQYKTHGQNPPIVGYFNTWTRLTEKDIHKMTKAEATIKGHLSQTRKNYQSTTTNNISGEDQGHLDSVQEPENYRIYIVMATVNETHKIYTNQTGKSPITSSQCKTYILIMYVYDANTILASPLKSISGSHRLEVYTKHVKHLTTRR